MNLQDSSHRSLPLWLVRTGDCTLGPVPTRWLLEGIAHGHVTDECTVREIRSQSWRALHEVREVARMRRRQRTGEGRATGRAAVSGLTKAENAEEVLLFTLATAARLTHADLAVATRVRDYARPPTTTCISGDGLDGLLGMPVSARDLSLGAARAGRGFAGSPGTSAVHQAAAERLSSGGRRASSIMMVPIGRGPALFGMIELARTDHDFRTTDLGAVTRLATAAWRRIERLSRSGFE